MTSKQTCSRWRLISLALWLTLCGTPAGAQTTAPADSIPGPDVSLGLLIETQDAAGYLWPRARGELSEILARRVRLKAALRDTVSALNAAHRDSLSARDQVEDDLRTDLRWTTLDLEHERRNRPHWWERPALVVPVTVIATLLAVNITID